MRHEFFKELRYMAGPVRVAEIVGKWLGGGVESVVMNYYRNIDRTKVQFDFICDEDSTDIPYGEIERLGGKVIIVPPYQKVAAYHKELKRVLKEGGYRIVHSHVNTLSVFSLCAAKGARVPVRIAHSHSTTSKKEVKRNILKQILRPFSKRYATDYMCCSEVTGRWMFGDRTYDAGKVFLLRNAIDLDKFRYDEEIRRRKRAELGIGDGTFVVGHIGRFVTTKNHAFLLDIFDEIHKRESDSLLLLAGKGPEEEAVKEKVGSLGLEDAVKFLGQRSDVAELYQAFDAFVLPSLYEGLTVVGIEAQAAGDPCFFSDAMTTETKVTDGAVFISLGESAGAWAEKILSDVRGFTRRDTHAELAASGYDIKREASRLEEKYLQLTGN